MKVETSVVTTKGQLVTPARLRRRFDIRRERGSPSWRTTDASSSSRSRRSLFAACGGRRRASAPGSMSCSTSANASAPCGSLRSRLKRLMTFFEDRPGKVEELLTEAAERAQALLMPVVNWGEVYYSVWRTRGKKAANEKLREISQLPIEVVDVGAELTRPAAGLN